MLVETDIRGILLGLEKKRADLRYALKDCICVPVALRDHVKIHLIPALSSTGMPVGE